LKRQLQPPDDKSKWGLGESGMKSILVSTALAAVIAVAGVSSSDRRPGPDDGPRAEKIGNFQLTDTTRLAPSCSTSATARPSWSCRSPTARRSRARSAGPALAERQAAYKDKGVLFYMMNSNLGQSP